MTLQEKVWLKKTGDEPLCYESVILASKALEAMMAEHQDLHVNHIGLSQQILPTSCTTITHLSSREHALSLDQPQTAFHWRPLDMPPLEESREVSDSNAVCRLLTDQLCD